MTRPGLSVYRLVCLSLIPAKGREVSLLCSYQSTCLFLSSASFVKECAAELETKYKIKTMVVVVDFTEPGAVYDKMVQGIKVRLDA